MQVNEVCCREFRKYARWTANLSQANSLQKGVNVGGKILFPDKLAGPFSFTYCATIKPR